MVRGLAAVCLAVLAVGPAPAGELKPEQARHFVIGKLFAFTCFEGTHGAGRVNGDGSVAGSVQIGGRGAFRYVSLPAGTLKVNGEKVCASVSGLPIEPCFNLDQTSQHSFRGSLAGLGFAYCDFTRRPARMELAGAASPRPIQSAAVALAHD